jgi:gluconolactonase
MKARLWLGAALALVVSGCESPHPMMLGPDGFPNLSKGGGARLVAKGAQLKLAGSDFGFTEGPAVDHFGNVFFTDQPNDKIYRWDRKTGAITEFLSPTGRANGMFFDGDGFLIAAADMHGELWSIDENGNHTVIVDNYQGNLLNGPNDLWIAPNGGIYFTDPLFVRDYWDADDPRQDGSQQGGEFLYYLSPDRQTLSRVGSLDPPDEPGGPQWPNGVIGSPDGKKLYVAQMLPLPGRIHEFDINPDGSLSNKRLFAIRSWMDGMTIDQRGNVYVAASGPEHPPGVDVYSPSGEHLLNIPTGQGWNGNVTFGGPNRKTLFITALGNVYTLEMHVRGVR